MAKRTLGTKKSPEPAKQSHMPPPLEPKNETQAQYLQALKMATQVFVLGPAGTGKAQPLDARIKVPGGWLSMGSIRPGTVVTAADGSETKVTAIYPQGEKEIFRVTFEDGRSTECCDDHLWRVYRYDWQPASARWRVIPLSEIREMIKKPSCSDNLYVQLPDPDMGGDVDVPLDPYLVGALLGDGHLGKWALTFTTADQFMADEVRRLLPDGMNLFHVNRYDYVLIKDSRQKRGENPLASVLRDLGVTGVPCELKYVPDVYLHASAGQRLSLLQGLMDTDGTVDKKTGTASFCSVSESLARDVQYLVRSLGGLARISEKATFFCFDGARREGKTAYVVNIRMRNTASLFRLPRKRKLAKEDHQYSNSLRLRIKTIEPVGWKPAQCISVEHPDHLYVTDDFIVTHNTFLVAAVAADMLRDGTVERIIITRPNVPGGSGRSLGAFPGDRHEKMANWAAPVASRVKERLGAAAYDAALRRGAIEVVPFETMRGLSWEDCFVILDEAQNATADDMKMFLTRIGQGSRVVVNGDISQCDLRKQQSGLSVALYLIERYGIDATVVEFGIDDIVRSGTCAQWVRAFHAVEQEALGGYEGDLLREVLEEWEPEGAAC